jgi:hypothetical protein
MIRSALPAVQQAAEALCEAPAAWRLVLCAGGDEVDEFEIDERARLAGGRSRD